MLPSNQLTGFYMRAALVFNELNISEENVVAVVFMTLIVSAVISNAKA